MTSANVTLWDRASDKALPTLNATGLASRLMSSDTNRTLAVGTSDRSVWSFDTATGKLRAMLITIRFRSSRRRSLPRRCSPESCLCRAGRVLAGHLFRGRVRQYVPLDERAEPRQTRRVNGSIELGLFLGRLFVVGGSGRLHGFAGRSGGHE